MSAGDLSVVGWREWVAVPAWGITAIKAKVDTGARTSALHAFDLHEVDLDGTMHARFEVHPWQRSARDPVEVTTPIIDQRAVTSSTGNSRVRPVVMVPIEVAGRLHTIEVTLTRRDDMGFRMLLGRQAIRKRFLVDPGRSYLGGRPDRATIRRNRAR